MSLKSIVFAAIGLFAMVDVASAQLVFSEDWDDLNGASRWSAPIISLEVPALGFDGLVDYAFDYSALGAPSAPHSVGGSTIGLRLETNKTDSDGDEGEAVGVVPLSVLAAIPAGDFSLKVDAYSFVNTNDGTTEYTSVGVFNHGTAVPHRFGINNGDGLAWSYTGEDGSGNNSNIYRFINPPGTQTGFLDWEDIAPGSVPGINTCHPGVDCPGNTKLGPQNQWVEVEIKSVAGVVSFAVNGYVIDTFDNTSAALSGGTLLLSESDPFNSVSIPDASGYKTLTVFDNVRLSVIPEPGSALLMAFGIIGFVMNRRRS